MAGVIIVATLLAIGLRLYQLYRPGYLFGITEYDDGTDFGSAVRLASGALPYRDFIMVQPPGITLLMAPVALATKGVGTAAGMATARVLTALASAAAVPLAGLLTRHRGLLAVIVSCGLLAVFPESVLAARTVLLEPWLVLFCLLGALAVFDSDRIAGWQRLLVGGCAFGFAGAVKVWAILPVLVILALTARRPRHAAVFAAGVAAGFVVPVLPFALTAPATFYRSVVVAQLVRVDVVRIPAGYRLQHMLGLSHLPQLATPALTAIGLLAIAIIVAVTLLGSRLANGPPPPLDWFVTITALLIVAAFLWPADFYYHYAGFLAPFLALSIALPAARLLAAVPQGETGPSEQAMSGESAQAMSGEPGKARSGEPAQALPGPTQHAKTRQRARLLRRYAVPVAAVTVVGLGVLQAVAEGNLVAAVPMSEIHATERMIPRGACVVTDQVSYTIAINRFVADSPGCSLMIDGVGSDYALSNGRNGATGAGRTPAVAALWMSAFRSARYLWLTGQADRRIAWTPQLLAYFHARFQALTNGPDWLYVRKR